jgi:hypothetical protein
MAVLLLNYLMRTGYFILGILFAPLFIYSSCKKATRTSCDGVACTMVFVGVNVQVVDKNNDPVLLDNAYTVRDGTNEKIIFDIPIGPAGKTGNYTVLDDSYQQKLVLSTAGFHFIGIKDGKEVVNEPYTFSADCCHINKKSGKDVVVLP